MDKSLIKAFGISLAFHVLILGVQFVRFQRENIKLRKHATNLIYDYQSAKQELAQLEQSLSELVKRQADRNAMPGIETPRPQIRIPQRPLMDMSELLPRAQASRHAVVDLTNLADAAAGNPVLLSYFSAIREQIQRTANEQSWQVDRASEGLIYVQFLLNASGQVSQVNVMADRSVSSDTLRDIALKIVTISSPFPPFPPSLLEPSKTVVVPLEFLFGS